MRSYDNSGSDDVGRGSDLPKDMGRREPVALPTGVDEYVGESSVFVVRLRDHARLLRARVVVVPLLEILNRVLAENHCGCDAFCFLTNELRVVVTGSTDAARVRPVFVEFKAVTERWFRDSGFPGWDGRFFTRKLTTQEERHAAIEEVLSAPAHVGSGDSTRHYPFVGPQQVPVEG